MIIGLTDLEKIRKENKNKKIVLALGAFDLIHFEHVEYLKDAKKLGDILVVSVKDDATVKDKGENRPIINEEQRRYMVNELKCVDYVVLTGKDETLALPKEFKNDIYSENYFKTFYHVFNNLKPNILYYEINKKLQPSREYFSKLLNIELISRVRTARISTGKIIDKIKNNN